MMSARPITPTSESPWTTGRGWTFFSAMMVATMQFLRGLGRYVYLDLESEKEVSETEAPGGAETEGPGLASEETPEAKASDDEPQAQLKL